MRKVRELGISFRVYCFDGGCIEMNCMLERKGGTNALLLVYIIVIVRRNKMKCTECEEGW